MKSFTPPILALAIAAGVGYAADAKVPDGKFDLAKLRYRVDSESVFNNSRSAAIQKANSEVFGMPMRAEDFTNPTPVTTIEEVYSIGDLDAPNGDRWYYTAEFDYLEIPPHDEYYFTDRILQKYTFNLFDKDMKYIGQLSDEMDYQDDEVRTVLCELTPVVSRHFFDTDDQIELMVSFGVNSTTPGNNHYRTVIYKLGGEKDANGFDQPVKVMPDLVGDVVEGPSIDGRDNFYISFMSDLYDLDDPGDTEADPNEPEDEDFGGFWDYLLRQKAVITIYGRAQNDTDGPVAITSKAIRLIELPGDQESYAPMMSMVHNGEVYFVMSYYEQPFYNRYNNPLTDDMSMREENNLVVELYKAGDNTVDLQNTTKFPMTRDVMPSSSDASFNTCLFSYYGIGGMRYREDVLFDAPGVEPGKPDYIITRSNYQISTDSNIDSYYYYKHDGTLKHTLFEYAKSSLAMGDIDGAEPQQMFVGQDAWGYIFHFVDLYSGKQAAEVPAEYYPDDYSDGELLTVNVARTPVGKTYEYVFEMRYPEVDDQDNDVMRFMWIKKDGSFDHIDNVNMGTAVAYAQSFLSTPALAPHAYTTSDTPAYMVLVKRGVEGYANTEELLVAEIANEDQPQGKKLLNVGADSRGILSGIVPDFDAEVPSLAVYRRHQDTYKFTMEMYALPLNGNNSAIESVGSDNSNLTFDGKTLKGDGTIEVYTISGSLALSGKANVNLESLTPGIYVVVADGEARKLVVK